MVSKSLRGLCAAAALASATLLTGCGGEPEVPVGRPEARTLPGADFRSITVQGPDRVIVRQGETFSIAATGRAGLLDRMQVTVANGTLIVARQPGIDAALTQRLGTATITVTMPRLENVEVSGSGELRADRMDAGSGRIGVTGSGNVAVNDSLFQRVTIAVIGSGNAVIGGRAANHADVQVEGAGTLQGTTFGSDTANINVTGSGDVAMTIYNSADVRVTGSGDVVIQGGGQCRINRTGSGEVSCN